MAERELVHFLVERGRLRLTWSYRGRRYRLSTGVPDSSGNRRALRKVVAAIERDILYGELDETLERYRESLPVRRRRGPPSLRGGGLLSLWAEWAAQQTHWAVGTRQQFMADFERLLARCPYQRFEDAVAIKQWLLQNTSPRRAKQMLQKLATLHTWAVERGYVRGDNPFIALARSVVLSRYEEDEDIDPFSRQECLAILEAYGQHRYHFFYAPLIRFLLLTGCRPSEALGLRWRYVEPSRIVFAESAVYVRSTMIQKLGTKTQSRRFFPVNDELRRFLDSLPRPDDLDAHVFVDPDGRPLNYAYFLRSWAGYKVRSKQVGGLVRQLVEQGQVLRYRSPYNLRHTAITWMLEAGITLPQIAQWVGNSPEIILAHYAGVVQRAEVPTLLECAEPTDRS